MLNTLLAENDNTNVLLLDKHNEVQKLRRHDLTGQSPIESLFTFLETFQNEEERAMKSSSSCECSTTV
jgi:hypothetical protein